jgi:hypothetical protein
MSTTASRHEERPGRAGRQTRVKRPRLIRQASAWLPQQAPEPLPLQDLEQSEALRWVDIYGGDLRNGEVLALLAPICRGQLTEKMVRDLIIPQRFAAGGSYRDSDVVITSGFRIRHLHSGTNGSEATSGHGGPSVFEPVQMLVGDDWLLSCWLPSRVFRGMGDPVHVADDSSSGLYLAVAKRWPTSNARGADGLAKLVRHELSGAAVYRPPIN